jgi:hypothetical protein
METGNLGQAAYWGGWLCAIVALAYKALFTFGLLASPVVQVFPRHLWQLSFLLFIIAIASASLARARSS